MAAAVGGESTEIQDAGRAEARVAGDQQQLKALEEALAALRVSEASGASGVLKVSEVVEDAREHLDYIVEVAMANLKKSEASEVSKARAEAKLHSFKDALLTSLNSLLLAGDCGEEQLNAVLKGLDFDPREEDDYIIAMRLRVIVAFSSIHPSRCESLRADTCAMLAFHPCLDTNSIVCAAAIAEFLAEVGVRRQRHQIHPFSDQAIFFLKIKIINYGQHRNRALLLSSIRALSNAPSIYFNASDAMGLVSVIPWLCDASVVALIREENQAVCALAILVRYITENLTAERKVDEVIQKSIPLDLYMPLLIDSLGEASNSSMKFYATALLASLADNKYKEAQDAFRDAGGIPLLLRCLNSENQKIARYAVFALESILNDNRSNIEAVLSEGMSKEDLQDRLNIVQSWFPGDEELAGNIRDIRVYVNMPVSALDPSALRGSVSAVFAPAPADVVAAAPAMEDRSGPGR